MKSFSSAVKTHLLQRSFEELDREKWKPCCSAAFLHALLSFVKSSVQEDRVSFRAGSDLIDLFSRLLEKTQEVKAQVERFPTCAVLTLPVAVLRKTVQTAALWHGEECEKCGELFLRAAFLACGTVLNPERGYHAAYRAKNDDNARALLTALATFGIAAKCEHVHKETLVYLKESEKIVDLFTHIGAQKYSMILVNQKIERSIRADINRRQNFDAANIKKTVQGAQSVISHIHYLEKRDLLVTLPDALQKAAKLRLSYPEVSLDDLCGYSDESITKSGLNHRLQKLVQIAQNHRKEETKS